MVGMRYRFPVWGTLIPLALAAVVMARSNEPTVEELKARIASTSVRDRPHLCVEIAQKQLSEADKLYAASDFDKGQAALTDVVAYSELARDYAIQSHKYQKQTEIATRNMTRKLNDLLHSLGGPDQAPVRDAISRLQRVRDDLLAAMFPKGAK
jgi:NAD-specific glutamate dehydrogenase